MNRAIAGGLAAVLVVVCPALAQNHSGLHINVGNVGLLPDTPNQPVEIKVTGGANVPVESLNFYIQVADGGPEAGEVFPQLEGIAGPKIQSIDLETGTIFAVNNDGQDNGTDPWPQQTDAYIATDVNNETPVYAEGLVATVYLDTTGFGLGSPGDPWDLRLGNILDGIVGDIGTGFAHQSVGNILPEITNGTITIIPEPSTCVMLVLCGLCLLGWRLRRGKDS